LELPLGVCEFINGKWSTGTLGNNSCLLSGFEGIDKYFQSVIASHSYDSEGNELAFARLGNLLAGDRIYVTYNGQVYEFEVISSLLTSPDDIRALLSPDDEGLAMIACAGEWSTIINDYSDRLVVYAARIRS
jgi:LPXTG-site transpeptidase (sortase) family protein